MNVLLWMVQIVLVLLAFSGGAYKLFMSEELATMPATAALAGTVGAVLGVFEVVCAVLLIVPAITKWKPFLTPLAAAALALESLVVAVWYAQFSLEMTAANPLVWVVAIALMAAFVAYGRYALKRH